MAYPAEVESLLECVEAQTEWSRAHSKRGEEYSNLKVKTRLLRARLHCVEL
jgi:hypothetical protein